MVTHTSFCDFIWLLIVIWKKYLILIVYTRSLPLSAVSLGWTFCTGFLEYKITAKLTIAIETMVFVLIGMLNKIQHNTAVKISSTALAKVFSIEFKVFRKKLVIIPTSELFNIIKITFGCRNVLISTLVSVSLTLFVNTLNRTIATMLQKILSMYINTFCIKMSMSAPCCFSKYSLYTPAKQEHVVCKARCKIKIKKTDCVRFHVNR